MNLQFVIVLLLFLAAVFYIGRMLVLNFSPKKTGCGGSCKCGIDFSETGSLKPKA